MALPQIKSRRQHIRLWFEFYKLALDDPALQGNLAKVRAFYEPWGDPRGVDFRVWWKDHGYLFGATQVEEATKVSKAPNVLNVSIPLNLPWTCNGFVPVTYLTKPPWPRMRAG